MGTGPVPQPEPLTGVIAALPLEARTARALAAGGWRVATSGVGQRRAHDAASWLCAQGVRRLLVWGVAGALDAQLVAGDVLVPAWVADTQGTCWHVDTAWQAQLLAAVPPAVTAVASGLVTVDAPVAEPRAKARLGRSSGAVGVDMEAAAVARCAQAHGLPFAVVRAIVDPVAQAVPPAVLQTQAGHYPTLAVARRLAAHPGEVAQVASLARHMGVARRSLTLLAQRLAADAAGY